MLRSTTLGFNWKEMCFFCSEETSTRHLADVSRAMTLELRDSVLQCCVLRADDWGVQVKGRLEGCCDLVAEEAVYHRTCYKQFVKCIYQHSDEAKTTGRPQDSDMAEAFGTLCDWLESSCEQDLYSLDELQQRMSSEGTHYSSKHLKRKLIERYGGHIVFSHVGGRHNVIGFKNMVSYILSDKWYANRKRTEGEESVKVVDAAAKLIAAQIRDLKSTVDSYPSPHDVHFGDDVESPVPPLLLQLMKRLVPSKLKQESLCQSIVQSSRPRSVLMPIPFSLAVSVDHSVASKSLLQLLAHLGYSVSYEEVTRFKQSVVACSDAEVAVGHGDTYPHALTRWVADNVDHNVRTVDGTGTFHGMGIISASVAMTGSVTFPHQPVKRLQSRLIAAETALHRGIPIIPYAAGDIPKSGLRSLSLKSVQTLMQPLVLPFTANLNFLWHAASLFADDGNPRPSWSGFMHQITTGQHSSAASVQMMPLIDMNPSDETCIYSTMLFVIKQAEKLSIPCPCITFDLPIWLKAVDIATAKELNIVCCLGGFHLLMNFMGSIGSLMCGSGLQDIFRLCYGRDTVPHMMTGKAYTRALRGHILADGALMCKLISLVVDGSNSDLFCDSDKQLTSEELSEIQAVYESVLTNKIDVTDTTTLNCASLVKLESDVNELKSKLMALSRTAKLWLLYMDYVSIVKLFILAQRTGNWHLHLAVTSRMLNLFAATGHHNYARCARLYLQLMTDLPSTHPWLYEQFSCHGFHSIRRSDKFWGGLSADLLIEQTMMKAVKSRSGLTHGRGMDESVRLLWVLSMHQCASVHLALRSLAGLEASSERHVELGVSRMKRDRTDMFKVLTWLDHNDPFSSAENRIRCISTGLTASDDDCINCDSAEQVGALMHDKVTDVSVVDAPFKKADQVKTLQHLASSCHIQNKAVMIDTAGLFHRLILLVERSGDVAKYFEYELTAAPASLFKCSYMRKADKSVLAKELRRDLAIETGTPSMTYVVDGGALLHRVRWLRHSTYAAVMQQYVAYVTSKYGSTSVVVFDGYMSGPSIKDHEHRRRNQRPGSTSPEILFHENSPVVTSQQSFLANAVNKSKFIDHLKLALQAANCETVQAAGDADTAIVTAALQIAASRQCAVGVVADDTDILVMLVHHVVPLMSPVYFVSEAQKVAERRLVNISSLQQHIGLAVCQQILVVHAIGGCDSTSGIYGFGKGTVLRKLTKSNVPVSYCETLQTAESSLPDVVAAGMQLLTLLFGGKPGDTLNRLRYSAYCKLAAQSLSRPQPEKLPPTDRAAYFHVLRTHLQAVRWKNLNDSDLLQTGAGS